MLAGRCIGVGQHNDKIVTHTLSHDIFRWEVYTYLVFFTLDPMQLNIRWALQFLPNKRQCSPHQHAGW